MHFRLLFLSGISLTGGLCKNFADRYFRVTTPNSDYLKGKDLVEKSEWTFFFLSVPYQLGKLFHGPDHNSAYWC